jgi:tRNA (adenine37-N6)-methyltransferase
MTSDASTMTDDFTLRPIAHIRSCYPERFGIPRQSGLVPAATAQIVFANTGDNQLALRGIEEFSHLWVIFWFHGQDYGATFKPLVSPPRLGGRTQVGVYASRSPNRPNPIGLSAVKLDRLELTRSEILLHISGVDLLDGTPVLDLKPYIPYADAIPAATSAWATLETPEFAVSWTEGAIAALEEYWAQGRVRDRAGTQALIEGTIGQDPRPAHERGKDGRVDQQWNLRVGGFDVFWCVEGGTAWITRLVQLGTEPR